ncbi:hypothetical protein Q3G72_009534 [Acer saccharum]|nr:hypothetical protein Q3G72_026787 [Acer saccharum]KAK1591560.1 hypothetical protein Q3G72_009534 [Acer saccharum]
MYNWRSALVQSQSPNLLQNGDVEAVVGATLVVWFDKPFDSRGTGDGYIPATVKESNKARIIHMDDDEVDDKTDDFINKFKQQLKLQRIDSILRYKETVNRTGGNKK